MKWPGHGWCIGHISTQVTCVPSYDNTFAPRRQANFKILYCDSEQATTDHEYDTHYNHFLYLDRHVTHITSPTDYAWVLLSPITDQLEPNQTSDQPATMGCGMRGCPGMLKAFTKGDLLKHARQAHNGRLDDKRLRWAGAVLCKDCRHPFPPSSLSRHYVRDRESNTLRAW